MHASTMRRPPARDRDRTVDLVAPCTASSLYRFPIYTVAVTHDALLYATFKYSINDLLHYHQRPVVLFLFLFFFFSSVPLDARQETHTRQTERKRVLYVA